MILSEVLRWRLLSHHIRRENYDSPSLGINLWIYDLKRHNYGVVWSQDHSITKCFKQQEIDRSLVKYNLISYLIWYYANWVEELHKNDVETFRFLTSWGFLNAAESVLLGLCLICGNSAKFGLQCLVKNLFVIHPQKSYGRRYERAKLAGGVYRLRLYLSCLLS